MFCWPITACGHADDGVSFLDLFQALQLIISWLQRHGDLSTSFLRWICWASKNPWRLQEVMSAQTSTERFGEMSKVAVLVGSEPLRSHGQYCCEVELDPKCQRFHPPNQWYPMIRSMRCSCRFFFGSFPPYRIFQTGWDFERSRAQWSFPPNRVVEDFRCGKHGSTACPEWWPTIFCLEWRTVHESEQHNLTGILVF